MLLVNKRSAQQIKFPYQPILKPSPEPRNLYYIGFRDRVEDRTTTPTCPNCGYVLPGGQIILPIPPGRAGRSPSATLPRWVAAFHG